MTVSRSSSDDLPDGRLEERAGTTTIVFERRFPQPVAAVWDALTRPERLAEWWLPFDAEIELDLVEGGIFEMRSTSGDPVVLSLRVLKVDPPRLFEHTHVEPGDVCRWELEPDGDGCLLTLSQTVTAQGVARNYLVGLHMSLERLVALVGGTPVAWDWDRFAEHQRRYASNGLATPPSDDAEDATT